MQKTRSVFYWTDLAKFLDFQVLEAPVQALHLGLDSVFQLVVLVVVLSFAQVDFGIVVQLEAGVVVRELVVAVGNHVLGERHLVLFSSLNALGETLKNQNSD